MKVVRDQKSGVSELLSQFLTSANCEFAEIRGKGKTFSLIPYLLTPCMEVG